MGAITRSVVRLHLLCAFFAIGSFIWGYNVGILSSVLAHPGFDAAFAGGVAAQKSAVAVLYPVGTLAGYLVVAAPAADHLGRRRAALAGVAVLALGTALEAAAPVYAVLLVARLVGGLGVAVLSTVVPLYQSEVAPAGQRGKYVVLNHVGFVAGLAAGFWVGYAVTFWDGTPHDVTVSWRVSIAVVLVPAAIFAVGLLFVPESPRWLIDQGHYNRAMRVLYWLREGSFGAAQIDRELKEIRAAVTAAEQQQRQQRQPTNTGPGRYYSYYLLPAWLRLINSPPLFARLWRAFLVQFLAQLCGATAMTYYLPTLFLRLGLGHRVALLAGGIESCLQVALALLAMLLMDRLGRRAALVLGAAAMAAALLANAVLGRAFPDPTNNSSSHHASAADVACVVFIFIYAVGYSMGFGPAAWVYASEIFPQTDRARGLNFSASGGALGSIIAVQVLPVGIERIGSDIYFFFFAVTAVIWTLYPEPKGRALEAMDDLFGGGSGSPSPPQPSPQQETDRRGRRRFTWRISSSTAAAAATATSRPSDVDEEHAEIVMPKGGAQRRTSRSLSRSL